MTLANDYRPDELSEFVGSESTIKALKSKLKSKSTPHVYLFTGPSGCGKTTLARILARHFGSIFEDGDISTSLDYAELDTADFRGIDVIRTIRRKMHNAPKRKNKTYLLDECHQLTKDAQEALLKALEDTPDHVYFILATTNPEKLKTTLKRRCAHFALSPLTDEEMEEHLEAIVEAEEKKVPKDIIESITEKAQGSPGIAMNILDKVIDLKKKDMKKEVEKIKSKEAAAIELCRALFQKKKWNKITSIIKELKEINEDPESIRRMMLRYCSSVLLKKNDGAAYLIMDTFRDPFYDMPWEQLILACYESRYSD